MKFNALVLSTLLMTAGFSVSYSQDRSPSNASENNEQVTGFPVFEGSFSTTIGNHGSVSIELIEAGLFKTPAAIRKCYLKESLILQMGLL